MSSTLTPRVSSLSGLGWRLALAGGALWLAAPAALANEITIWHTLNAHNAKVLQDLARDFQRSKDGVAVKLRGFADEASIESALAKATKRADRPQLVQLDDHRAPTDIARRSDIQPLHVLFAHYPAVQAKWFVSSDNTFLRDTRGRLLAFPYMMEVPVMFYNVDAFKKAGLTPTVPQRTWAGLQDQLVTLANNGSRQCPATSDQPVSINLENLAAVNNQWYNGQGNGLGKGQGAFTFDSTYIRHLSLMISWVRSELMVKPEYNAKATQRFAAGECAILLSTSGNLGAFQAAKGLNFGVSGLPYYPEVTKTPGNPFVGGSALWVVSGHPKESDASTAKLLAWLAQPEQAGRWYQNTGFLPMTQQAFANTEPRYYRDLGDWRNLVASYANKPGPSAQGFRVQNYPKIRAMFHDTLARALAGQEPAVTSLKMAATEAGKIARQK